MPQFVLETLGDAGNRIVTTIEAPTIEDVISGARAAGLEPISVGPVQDSTPQDEVDPDSTEGLTDLDQPTIHYEPSDERPGPAPRPIPSGTNGTAGGLVMMLVGSIFAAVATIMIFVGLGTFLAGNGEGLFMIFFPMIHLTIGVGLLIVPLRGRSKRRELVRDGSVAVATIASTGYNRSVKINGRNPYQITFDFEVDGRKFSGKRSTMNKAVTRHSTNDRIWVIYEPEDPSHNMEWPPL